MAPLVGVATTLWGMEWSVHEVPKRFEREAQEMFAGMDLAGLLIVPTCQQAKLDLVNVGETVETEKDFLLERFMAFAADVCEQLVAQGHWADYIDPCSGLTMLNKENRSVYGEVEALVTLLNYQTANAGCCKVALHPRWGSKVYPATLFTKAPVDALVAAIKATEAKLKGTLES